MTSGLADPRPEAPSQAGAQAAAGASEDSSAAGAADEFHRRRLKALRLVVFAALLEVTLILPFVDHLADANPTVHFTQHGFIFLGGVLMGIALRDAYRSSPGY